MDIGWIHPQCKKAKKLLNHGFNCEISKQCLNIGVTRTKLDEQVSLTLNRAWKKSRQWHNLESSVEVLRVGKYDKIKNFHRKKVGAPQKKKPRSAIIKIWILK